MTADLRWARYCYGVDLAAGKPVVARAQAVRGRVQFSRIDGADPGAGSGELRGNAVSAGYMPVQDSLTHRLETPFSSMSKTRKVLPTLLDIQLPFPIESCSYCFIPMPAQPGETNKAFWAVAARKERIAAVLDSYREAGFDPMILDHEGLALWSQYLREFPAGLPDAGGLAVIVKAEQDRFTLVIGRDGRFLSSHSVRPNDAAQAARLIQVQTEQTDNGAPAETQWIWAGSMSAQPESLSDFRNQLLKRWPGKSSVCDTPETFLARALATRALTADNTACNLRAGETTHPALLQRARTRSLRSAAALGLCGLLLSGISLATRAALNARLAGSRQSFRELADRLAGYHVDADGRHAVTVVRRETETRTERLRHFAEFARHSLAYALASVTDTAKRLDIRFHSLVMNANSVSVSGTAGDLNRLSELAACLGKYGYDVKSDYGDPIADTGRVPFNIRTREARNE